MKRRMFILLIFLFLLMPLISAADIEMKSNFSQGETLIAKVSGNFIQPLTKENIFLYRGHVRVPFESYVSEINGDFYIYGQLLGKQPGNYSLSLENIKYMKAGVISDENIIKNFIIENKTADFLVEPGFIITDKDFSIEVQNLQDYQILISVQGINLSENFTLKADEIKKINFNKDNFKNFSFLKIKTENLEYDIPTFLYKIPESSMINLTFKPSILNVSMATNSNITKVIFLFNYGKTIENLSLSVSDSLAPYVSIYPTKIEKFENNSNIDVNINISSSGDEEILEGKIFVKKAYVLTSAFLSINITKNFVPSEEEKSIFPTCEEIEGEICSKGEECKGETENVKDGVCCLGTCKEIKKSSIGKIIVLIISVIVVIFLIWFYKKKYKGAKRSINLLKISEKGK